MGIIVSIDLSNSWRFHHSFLRGKRVLKAALPRTILIDALPPAIFQKEIRHDGSATAYTKKEHAQRGAAIYEGQVRPVVEAENQGKIVAIDVETGAFEVADETLSAADRLLVRCPDAQIWFVRIGHRGVHRFGLHKPTEAV